MKTQTDRLLYCPSGIGRLLPVIVLSVTLVGCSDSSERGSGPTGGDGGDGTGAFTTAVALRVTEALHAAAGIADLATYGVELGQQRGVISAGVGRTAAYEVTTPVRWAATCPFPLAGTVVLDLGGPVPATMDYGSGRCDDRAVLTVEGETRAVQLPRR